MHSVQETWLPVGDDASGIFNRSNGAVSVSCACTSVAFSQMVETNDGSRYIFFRYGQRIRGGSRFATGK